MRLPRLAGALPLRKQQRHGSIRGYLIGTATLTNAIDGTRQIWKMVDHGGAELMTAETKKTQKTASGRQPYYGNYYAGPYGAGPYGDSVDPYGGIVEALSLKWIARMLKRYWVTILLSAVLGVSGGAYFLTICQKEYVATAAVEMSVRRPRIMNRQDAVLDDVAGSWRVDEVYRTRVERLQGAETMRKVSETLQSKHGALKYEVPLAGFNLVRDSRVVWIACRHTDPQWAAECASAYAAAAEQLFFDENKTESEKAVAWLRSQAEFQSEALAKIEKQIVGFRGSRQMDLQQSRKNTTEQAVTELSRQLVSVEAEEILARELCSTLEGIKSESVDLGKLPGIMPLTQEIQSRTKEWRDAVTKFEALQVKFKGAHPEVVAAQRVVDVMQAEAMDTIRRATQMAKTNHELLKRQIDNLKARIEAERKAVAELDLVIAQTKAEYANMERTKQASDISYAGILNRIEEARLSADENTTTVKVLKEATVPLVPVYPRPVRVMFFALMAGLALGGGVSLAKDMLNDQVSSPADVEQLGLRVVGFVPRAISDKRVELATVSLRNEEPELRESFASIRAYLTSPQYIDRARTLLVTSTAPAEGKTILSSNLAVMFARSGMRTLLVDFDLRRPRIGTIFSVPDQQESLTSCLQREGASDADFAKLAYSTDCRNLDVISSRLSGELRVADLIGSERVRHFVEWAKRSYEQVIIDSPPHGVLSDAAVLAGLASGVLIVCRAHKSRVSAIKHTVRHFGEIGGEVLGVVVNAISRGERSSYYGYGYDYKPTHAD